MFPTYSFYGTPATTRQLKSFLEENKYVKEMEIEDHVKVALTTGEAIDITTIAETAVNDYLQTAQLPTEEFLQTNYVQTTNFLNYANQFRNELDTKVDTTQLAQYTPTSTLQSTYATKASLSTVDDRLTDIDGHVEGIYGNQNTLNQQITTLTNAVSRDFATKTEVQTGLNSKVDTNQLTTQLANYTPTSTLQNTYATQLALNSGLSQMSQTFNNQLTNYTPTSTIQNTYATKVDLTNAGVAIQSTLQNYATKQDLTDIDMPDLSTYATKTELTDGLREKVDGKTLTPILNSITATQTTLTNGLANKVDTTQLTTQLANYTPTSTLQSTYATKQDLVDIDMPDLSSYATQTALTDGLATKVDTTQLTNELATIQSTYATQTEVQTGLATKVDTTQLANYTPTSTLQSTYATQTSLQDLENVAATKYNADDVDEAMTTRLQGYTTLQRHETLENFVNFRLSDIYNRYLPRADAYYRPLAVIAITDVMDMRTSLMGHLITLKPSLSPEPTTAVFRLNGHQGPSSTILTEFDLYNASMTTVISFDTTNYTVLYRDPNKTRLSPNGCAHIKLLSTVTATSILILGNLQE